MPSHRKRDASSETQTKKTCLEVTKIFDLVQTPGTHTHTHINIVLKALKNDAISVSTDTYKLINDVRLKT